MNMNTPMIRSYRTLRYTPTRGNTKANYTGWSSPLTNGANHLDIDTIPLIPTDNTFRTYLLFMIAYAIIIHYM